QPRLVFVLLLDVLVDVEADRGGEKNEQADHAGDEPARAALRTAAARAHGGVGGAAAENGGGERKQLRNADERADHQFRGWNGERRTGSHEPEPKGPNGDAPTVADVTHY